MLYQPVSWLVNSLSTYYFDFHWDLETVYNKGTSTLKQEPFFALHGEPVEYANVVH
jgi:hypothetical protein